MSMFQQLAALILLVCSSALLFLNARVESTENNVKNYIVYMSDGRAHQNLQAQKLYNRELLAKLTTRRVDEAVIHHYGKSFRGFSALLTQEEAASLAEMDGIVSVFESKTWRVHTTHSWEFLGVNKIHLGSNTDYLSNVQSDVIIGVIDTGIWPESESFSDECLSKVPSRFKGTCETGVGFNASNCNRKIIGARFYFKGFEAENGPLESFGGKFFRSPRDADGHGSHTASIAAGALVKNASVFGIGKGTARGGSPGARLAIYKACWFNLCNDADLLAAFDDATNDGVDIISISVGPLPPQPSFFVDSISIGSFQAFRKGVFVSASAGNSGLPNTATNVAPWIFTVAASSIDRSFSSDVLLGNNVTLKGEAVNPLKQNGFAGLVPASSCAAPGVSQTNASFCLENTLDPTKVNGKVVVCTISSPTNNRTLKSVVVKDAGGVGIIIVDPFLKDVAFQFVIPGTLVGQQQGAQLTAYIGSDLNPTALIQTTLTVLNITPAPEMAVFSSMGPNVITPDIIKPDVTAPGVSILAAWSPIAISEAGGRSIDFNIISGTSMACPHVSGVAALIKAQHPTWSPAAIKSAIMTTASVIDNTNKSIVRSPFGSSTGPFDYGSGHINPVGALNPGLFYDYNVEDVINFLCSNGPTLAQLRNLTGDNTTCLSNPPPAYNFNYPSIGVANLSGNLTVSRTLTSAATKASLYTVTVQPPPGVLVQVLPNQLYFKKFGDKKSFTVKFTVTETASQFVFGSLTWSNAKYNVYTPIAVNPTSL
ncbi:hypothetical protein SUGI_1178360 [Cryptomeria japonica]|uniref:subtilisin-like serine-protease S n=1 Tax=Cryptomeria japonica TaxID=3369 RepID=UPI00241480F4|nr:subtilisin-like serine-protease S [Cryptomeria japonica]GLJ54872.1 hypothetical protein SUGI_1178360 [Cryptomeria japonica]